MSRGPLDAGGLVFAQAVGRPDDEIDLATAALLIAALEYPALDIPAQLRTLDDIAALARARGGDRSALTATLFDDLGFRGNRLDYHDARNSFLNDVLERRLGIPITLSVVFLEVGWRLGLPVEGVGYPGHFIVRAEGRLFDPFNGGRELDAAALAPEGLAATGKRAILARMLRNLAPIEPRRPWLDDLMAALARPPRRDGFPSS